MRDHRPSCTYCGKGIHRRMTHSPSGRPYHPGCYRRHRHEPSPGDCTYCGKSVGERTWPVEYEGQPYHPGCLRLKLAAPKRRPGKAWEYYPANSNPIQEALIQRYAQLVADRKRIFE